jgi:murein DD-endopeptidase MepM/ murein hydrolase activator NlpD
VIRPSAPLAALVTLAGCTAADSAGPSLSTAPAPAGAAVVQPIRPPAPAPGPTGPATFAFDGQLTQGGWIRGQVPAGTRSASLDGQALDLDPKGHFFAAFDRDARRTATLTARLADGRVLTSPVSVSPRDWPIERVNVARAPGGVTEAFMKLRRPELARIAAARAATHPVDGWRQTFIWPVDGRVSGRFGAQRIYRGEPAAYHSGLDIAPGAGAAYVAPADGVVVLAAESPFTLEGNLLIVDHGMGLNSAFLHSSRLVVKEGDVVRRGQLLGYVGMTGRATGPHLHWSIKWHDARLDPLLFVPPR